MRSLSLAVLFLAAVANAQDGCDFCLIGTQQLLDFLATPEEVAAEIALLQAEVN